MSPYDELINELSELCGIMPEYWDIFGKKQITSVEAKRAILMAMKLRVDSIDEIIKEINERKYKSWRSFIEPVYVTSVNEHPLKIPVFAVAVDYCQFTVILVDYTILLLQ